MKIRLDLSDLGLMDSSNISRDEKKMVAETIKSIFNVLRNIEVTKKLTNAQGIDQLIQEDTNECLQLCNELIFHLGDYCITDDPKFVMNFLTRTLREAMLEKEIDAEFDLKKLQMHKFAVRGGAERRHDREEQGLDAHFSWDSSFRQDWQPVFNPICYTRKIGEKTVYIPNVRTIMSRDGNKVTNFPQSFDKNALPAEEHITIEVPNMVEACGCKTNTTSETQIVWALCETTGKRKKMVYNRQRKQTVENTVEQGKKKISFLAKGGWSFNGSKEVGPPATYDENGQVKDWVCYADQTADRGKNYTMLGRRWENLRKRFLNDVHDGNVNICMKVEQSVDGRKVTHQAFKVYPVKAKTLNGDVIQFGMLLFCDIQPAWGQFAKSSDLKKIWYQDIGI